MAAKNYKHSLFFLLSHAFLGILWNVTGLLLISQGEQALGPSTSYVIIVLLLLLIFAYIFTLQKDYSTIYVFLAFIAFSMSFYTIVGGFTQNHSLWPSDFWRYTGMGINILGIIGFVYALKTFAARRKLFEQL